MIGDIVRFDGDRLRMDTFYMKTYNTNLQRCECWLSMTLQEINKYISVD